MSNLSAFLNPVTADEEKEIVISKRFVDAKGNPVPFKIRAITQKENDRLTKLSMKSTKVNGQTVKELDRLEYARRLVVAATVDPDFSSKELCDRYGTMDPLEVPGNMLYTGEYQRLMSAIADLSGIGEDIDLGEEAKNF